MAAVGSVVAHDALAARPALAVVEDGVAQHQVADGVCPICSGSMELEYFDRAEDGYLLARFECRNCWMAAELPVGALVVRHPATVSFYYDHGVDIHRQFLTDLEFVGGQADAEFVADDRGAVELTITERSEAATFRIDDDLAVSEV